VKIEIMGLPVVLNRKRGAFSAVTQVKKESRAFIGTVPATTFVPNKHRKPAKHRKREREGWEA